MVVTGAVATASGPHPGGDGHPSGSGLGSPTRSTSTSARPRSSASGCSSSAGLARAHPRRALPGVARLGARLLAVLVAQMVARRDAVPQRAPVGARARPRHPRGADLGARSLALALVVWRPPLPLRRAARRPRSAPRPDARRLRRLTARSSADAGTRSRASKLQSMDPELRIDGAPTLRRPVLSPRSRAGTTAARARRSPPSTSRGLGRHSGSPRSTRRGSSTSRRCGRRSSLDEGLDPPDRVARERVSTTPRSPALDRDAVLLLGVEPNYRWRTFTGLVTGLAQRPRRRARRHARGAARRRAAHAARARDRRRDRSGARRGARAPARRATRARPASSACSTTPAASAGSARSASGPPCPTTSRSRRARAPRARSASRLGDLLGVPIDIAELVEAEEEYAAQVSEAVASDAETQAYVEELERRADTIELLIDGDDLPTGESLAAELTRFLREHERAPRGRGGRAGAHRGRRLSRAHRPGVGVTPGCSSGRRRPAAARRPSAPGARPARAVSVGDGRGRGGGPRSPSVATARRRRPGSDRLLGRDVDRGQCSPRLCAASRVTGGGASLSASGARCRLDRSDGLRR